VDDEKVRLGGMALANGVLVHGPNSWACAVRHPDGRLEVASAKKRFRAANVHIPLLRGPARLAEAIAVLPEVKRKLPAARLPMQEPGTLAAVVGAAVAVRGIRGSARLRPAAQELVSALRRSRRPRSRSAAESWPPITAPSTSRSAATSTGPRRRRSTSVAAVI